MTAAQVLPGVIPPLVGDYRPRQGLVLGLLGVLSRPIHKNGDENSPMAAICTQVFWQVAKPTSYRIAEETPGQSLSQSTSFAPLAFHIIAGKMNVARSCVPPQSPPMLLHGKGTGCSSMRSRPHYARRSMATAAGSAPTHVDIGAHDDDIWQADELLRRCFARSLVSSLLQHSTGNNGPGASLSRYGVKPLTAFTVPEPPRAWLRLEADILDAAAAGRASWDTEPGKQQGTGWATGYSELDAARSPDTSDRLWEHVVQAGCQQALHDRHLGPAALTPPIISNSADHDPRCCLVGAPTCRRFLSPEVSRWAQHLFHAIEDSSKAHTSDPSDSGNSYNGSGSSDGSGGDRCSHGQGTSSTPAVRRSVGLGLPTVRLSRHDLFHAHMLLAWSSVAARCLPEEQPLSQPVRLQEEQPLSQPVCLQEEQPLSQPVCLQKEQPLSQPVCLQKEQPLSQPVCLQKEQPLSQPVCLQKEQPLSQPVCLQEEQPLSQPVCLQEEQLLSQPVCLQKEQPLSQPVCLQKEQPLSQPVCLQKEQPLCQPVCLQKEQLLTAHTASPAPAVCLLFHAKEYPQLCPEAFPYNLGYCQVGSDVSASSVALDSRNILWMQGRFYVLDVSQGSMLHSQLLWRGLEPFRTVYESDLGLPLCTLSYQPEWGQVLVSGI